MKERPGSGRNAVPRLILASGSPRRAALLRQMGFEFIVMKQEIDESFDPKADPAQTAMRLSGRKAEATVAAMEAEISSAGAAPSVIAGNLVVAADTVVVLDGEIMGKPESPADAGRMLKKLSGRTHEVFTGFTLIETGTARRIDDFERTAVTFRGLGSWEIDDYVSTGMPMDKAGAYGIQDRSGLFVDRIDGCFYNVVGFPLSRFFEGLKQMLGPETVRGMISAGSGPVFQAGSAGAG
jgi:septum formation protein